MLEEHKWECPEDGMLFKKIVEQKFFFKFLLGLNQNLDKVRRRILGTEPLPNIREVFSEVRREESKKKVMMGSRIAQSTTESIGSTLATRVHGNKQRKGRPWCDNYRRSSNRLEANSSHQ